MKRSILPVALGLAIATLIGASATAQNRAATASCSESGPPSAQVNCYLETAEAENDVGHCTNAYDFAVRFACVSQFAAHTGDAVACERIPIRNNRTLLFHDRCISGVATATRTAQLCEGIQLGVVRDACFLTQVVEHNGAPELCDRISKAVARRSCLDPSTSPR